MRKATPWLVLLVLLVAAGAWYVLSREPAETHPSVMPLPEAPPPAVTPVPEYPVEAIEPPAEGEPEPEPLPPFEESDAAIIEALAALLGAEALDAHFVLEQVISRIVATIDSLPGREIAPLVLPVRPAPGKFITVQEGDTVVMSPDNAARYRTYMDLMQRVATDDLVAVYTRFYPLFQEAYESLGYPDGYFNDRLVEVIDHLLGTPQPPGNEPLVKPEAVYLYADEALESLSAGRKVMLRIGPQNADLVRAKLTEMRAAVAGREYP